MACSSGINNTIRNTLRSITKDLTIPQKKGIKEVFLGLMREGTTILNHISDKQKQVKVVKQAERYRRHLESVDLVSAVEKKTERNISEIQNNTVIAYDLSDIAKPHAKNMEGLSRIFDGSKRKITNGYTLHGVSIGNQPAVMQIHNANGDTVNQTRLEVIEKVQRKTGRKGIWVFDRGNDDQQFFTALKKKQLQFVIRLRSNRNFIEKETGEIKKCQDFLPGRYQVILPKSREEYTLVVHKHCPTLKPMRVITTLEGKESEDIIETYLERWDVENLFKQMKMKYSLESVRVLSLRKLKNILALVQMLTSMNNSLFEEAEKEQRSGVSLEFSHFCSYRCLSKNRFSFAAYLSSVTPQITAYKPPKLQKSLFSWRQVGKMGVF